jgi:hypothetical protein
MQRRRMFTTRSIALFTFARVEAPAQTSPGLSSAR